MTFWLVYIILILTIIIAYKIYQYVFPSPDINPNGKYVLISGCDTGFGHGLAIELDKQGFNVLAGIYNPNNIDTLTKLLSSRATIFKLDITRQEDIDSAYEMISTKTKTLHALVNNAGIGYGGLIDWITLESMRKMMDVNFFGHVAMTKRFLPLLISKRDSRVVNICSVGGYLATSGMASYCSSKFALEAFSDCLRREMNVWGLHVSIIEPGSMRTPMTDGLLNSVNDLWNGLSTDVKERWGEEFYKHSVERFVSQGLIERAENPKKVIKALKHAVMNTVPCIRYRPGLQSLLLFPLSLAPAWLVDRIATIATGASNPPSGIRRQMVT
jgi:NAD(P)-dependent dehydrogenase (short-subunit alcohol dehydrogenase family)